MPDLLLDRLILHLRPACQEEADRSPAPDTQIITGDQWKAAKEASLRRAGTAVLRISADFLASDFIVDNELPPLLKKADDSGTLIIPVMLNRADSLEAVTLNISCHQLTVGRSPCVASLSSAATQGIPVYPLLGYLSTFIICLDKAQP